MTSLSHAAVPEAPPRLPVQWAVAGLGLLGFLAGGLLLGAGGWKLGVLFAVGWAIVLASTFMIGHFDLFGFKQVIDFLNKKTRAADTFHMPGFYKFVRHPIMLGFIIAFWATPQMTVGHLLFAAVTTAYILIAIKFFEERDLIALFGEAYEEYRRKVPMLLPLGRKK